MEKLTVDIIIPVYRPDEKYIRLLQGLKKQIYPIHKIIIMNTERKYYEEDRYPQLFNIEVHHIQKSEFDHGGTRNQAVQYSNSDIIFFLTQDAVPPDRHLVENILKPFEDEMVAAVYGRQIPVPSCNIIERFSRNFNYPQESLKKSKQDLERLGIKTFFCSNVCAAYRRDIYDKLGGFPLHTIFNEDMIFTGELIKAGYTVAYEADAKVVHSHNYTGIQQFHRNFDLAVSQVDNPQIFSGIRSEGEGIRLVKQTMEYLIRRKKYIQVMKLIYISGCKYMGYLLGKKYKKLPRKFVIWCSMNREYWR
ncbi:MAG TPA: glycosyltransferase [Candidatus Fimimorpha faecalis]|uniref:Glycosyltransferase n=1 Tax=Candidatus Fimimorpha faecalis TaxID=2840824 RepID=A0A9D1EHB3_9FIRM|nr:glycosyltransferase [Candidatus Fimimorpha faecalis]